MYSESEVRKPASREVKLPEDDGSVLGLFEAQHLLLGVLHLSAGAEHSFDESLCPSVADCSLTLCFQPAHNMYTYNNNIMLECSSSTI